MIKMTTTTTTTMMMMMRMMMMIEHFVANVLKQSSSDLTPDLMPQP